MQTLIAVLVRRARRRWPAPAGSALRASTTSPVPSCRLRAADSGAEDCAFTRFSYRLQCLCMLAWCPRGVAVAGSAATSSPAAHAEWRLGVVLDWSSHSLSLGRLLLSAGLAPSRWRGGRNDRPA